MEKTPDTTMEVSEAWFQRTLFSNVHCPHCGEKTTVLVSDMTHTHCTKCKKPFTVEFKIVHK